MFELLIIDCETTGVDEPEVIELSAHAFDIGSSDRKVVMNNVRFKPSKAIQFGAMAAHHIMPSELEDCEPSADCKLPDCTFIAGHNVDFDWKALGSPEVKRICTLAMARRLWPDTDSHSLSALCYMLFGEAIKPLVTNAHSSSIDVQLTSKLLVEIIAACRVRRHVVDTAEQLWVLSEKARVPTHFTFGKHKGMLIKDAPKDYKAWMLRQDDVDEYLRKALMS